LRCPSTGEPLEYTDLPPFDAGAIDPAQQGLWRYAAMLPVVAAGQTRISLGEGWTPLIPDTWGGVPVHWKLDSLMPSGSYKDRGFSVLVNWLVGLNASIAVEDSSGNAGASLACYAARAELHACIYVPESAPAPKKAQVAVYGAELVEVPGPRSAATDAAVAATRLNKGTKYASHALHPAYLLGQMTSAWEIWEQLGGTAPDWFIAPVGQGGLLLGAWRGFQQLHAADLIDKLPRMVAVQVVPYTAIYDAFHAGLKRVEIVCPQFEPVSADGVAIIKPNRSVTVLEALRHSRGTAIAVSDKAVLTARDRLAEQGLFVEPTSATVAAALHKLKAQIRPGETVVAMLTGHGLKRPPDP
jgi:threonine synthase